MYLYAIHTCRLHTGARILRTRLLLHVLSWDNGFWKRVLKMEKAIKFKSVNTPYQPQHQPTKTTQSPQNS